MEKRRKIARTTSKQYFEYNKQKLKQPARNEYTKLYDKVKSNNREYGKTKCRNMPEENKQRLKKYQKNNHEANN